MPNSWFRKPASPGSSSACTPSLESLATELREVRTQICDVTSATASSAWSCQSPLPQWTYKDLLAHLAVNHWLLLTLLTNAAVNQSSKFSSGFDASLVEAASSVLREEWRDRALPELIQKVEIEGKETQRLVALLVRADARERTPSSSAVDEYLAHAIPHDREHLTQLRTALRSP